MAKIFEIISKIFFRLLTKISHRIDSWKKLQRVSLTTEKPYGGNVLLSYLIEQFLLKPAQPIPSDHTWYWECRQIARTFLDFGYNVDVNYGIILHQSTVAEIQNAVQMISSLDAKQLESMAKKSWEFARANHTRETFTDNYRRFVEKLVSEYLFANN